MRGAHPSAEFHGVIAMDQGSVVLHFITILQVIQISLAVAAAQEIAQDAYGRICTLRRLDVIVAVVLEARLVDDLRTKHLGVADLHGVFRALRVIGLGRQAELVRQIASLGIAVVLIARSQGIVLRQGPIQARAQVGALARIWNRTGEGPAGGGVRGIDGRQVIDVAPIDIEEE